MDSQFFYLKKIIKPKSDVQVELLRPRRFFRDQDRPNWLMSHFDVICVIWRHLRHLMSNDAYDIKIWHKSIWPILVSKEASGSQQFHTLIWFWLENCFKINKLKIKKNHFFLYEFWKILCIIEVQFQKVKCCRKTLKIMEMHFFTLNNDIFSGQQVWATFVEIGSPYPPPNPYRK